MICNSSPTANNYDESCTLNFCKQYAIDEGYKYLTYGNNKWCIMCFHNETDGTLLDEGDSNGTYTLYHCKGNVRIWDFFEGNGVLSPSWLKNERSPKKLNLFYQYLYNFLLYKETITKVNK